MSRGTRGASTREVVCGRCQSVNQQDRRFCAKCGHSLWENCLSCGTECSAAETYCGGCGTNLWEVLQKKLEHIEEALKESTKYEEAFQFERAICVLKELNLPEDPRLETPATRVRERLESLRHKERQHRETVEIGIERVQALLEAYHDEKAVELLEKLPAGLRNEKSEELLRIAKSRSEEVARLKADIRNKVQNKQYLELAPKIERWLAISPDSESAKKLAVQVRDKLAVAAKQQAQRCEYQKAVDVLSRVPESAVDDAFERLARQIQELHWLQSDLKFAPIIDEPLIEIAKRFTKQAPSDTNTLKLCKNIQRRATTTNANEADPRFPATTWIRSPQRTGP